MISIPQGRRELFVIVLEIAVVLDGHFEIASSNEVHKGFWFLILICIVIFLPRITVYPWLIVLLQVVAIGHSEYIFEFLDKDGNQLVLDLQLGVLYHRFVHVLGDAQNLISPLLE